MTECLFCRISAHDVPVTPLFEDELAIAFADLYPQAPTHLLVVPKQHFSSIEGVPAEVLGHLLHVAAELGGGHLPHGHRTVINTGDDGGQTVRHLHLHLLGGRQMTWPPG